MTSRIQELEERVRQLEAQLAEARGLICCAEYAEGGEHESDCAFTERDQVRMRLRCLAQSMRDNLSTPVTGPMSAEECASAIITERDQLRSQLSHPEAGGELP